MSTIKKEETEKAEALENTSGQIKTAEHELSEIKARYSELGELKGELTIEIREKELAISNLIERMREVFGCGREFRQPRARQSRASRSS
ncbi:MAG: hypothetical protein HS130_11840 [Deltaproteobacteria bacterium]|nr:hypothetical protein [Deltaproteobacteria bacterium]